MSGFNRKALLHLCLSVCDRFHLGESGAVEAERRASAALGRSACPHPAAFGQVGAPAPSFSWASSLLKLKLDGMKLEVEPEVLDLIVDTAIENKLGARGLRSICEAVMTDAMYEAPSTNEEVFHLTLEYAKEKLTK